MIEESNTSQQKVYFEKQPTLSLQCGLFSVNHLLGGKIYSKDSMNQICYELSDDFINPHKHVFGGDFDVNVLMVALQRHQMTTNWYDRRQGDLKLPSGKQQKAIGYLVNVFSGGGPSIFLRICGLSRRHWFAVRRVGDNYYWLDSKDDLPISRSRQQTELQLNNLLRNTTGNNDQNTEILVVARE